MEQLLKVSVLNLSSDQLMQQVWNDKSQEAGDTRQPPKMWAFKKNIVKPYFEI